jgi:hypothetical protein
MRKHTQVVEVFKHTAGTLFVHTEAILMLFELLPHAQHSIQGSVMLRLSALVEASPANRRALCTAGVFGLLLHFGPYLGQHDAYLQLVASLGKYDVSADEVRLLFDLASHRSIAPAPPIDEHSTPNGAGALGMGGDAMREEESSEMRESQMQMLYVIGRLAERSAPFAYFHFDGEGEGLALDPRGKFPSANTGYTFMCWLQADRFFDAETPLLTLGERNGPTSFELLFLVLF